MLGSDIEGVGGRKKALREGGIFTGVQISVKTGEIAAGNLQPQHVSLEKHVTRRPQINCELVHLSGIHQVSFLLRIAITGADDSFRQILRKSIGPTSTNLA
jgi:hypothetical protein